MTDDELLKKSEERLKECEDCMKESQERMERSKKRLKMGSPKEVERQRQREERQLQQKIRQRQQDELKYRDNLLEEINNDNWWRNGGNPIQEEKMPGEGTIEYLQWQMDLAVKEERYEDAAKLRDQIKNFGQ